MNGKTGVRLVAASIMLACSAAQGQDYIDAADDAAYDDGWQNADNGGSNLDPWVIQPDDNGFATNIAETLIVDAVAVGGSAAMNISGESFALHVRHEIGNAGGASVTALRPWSGTFPDGPQGKIFVMAQPATTSGAGTLGEIGINEGTTRLVTIQSKDSGTTWHIADAADTDTGIPRANPIQIAYTWTSPTSCNVRVTDLAGPTDFVSAGRTHAVAGTPDTLAITGATDNPGGEGHFLVNKIAVDPDASLPVELDGFAVD